MKFRNQNEKYKHKRQRHVWKWAFGVSILMTLTLSILAICAKGNYNVVLEQNRNINSFLVWSIILYILNVLTSLTLYVNGSAKNIRVCMMTILFILYLLYIIPLLLAFVERAKIVWDKDGELPKILRGIVVLSCIYQFVLTVFFVTLVIVCIVYKRNKK